MHLVSHVCCYYTPLSPLTEGWGTVTDLSSVPPKRTTDNFAFEGLNMQKRPKRVRAWGSTTIVWPSPQPQDTSLHTHTHTLSPRVTDGRMLAKANSELPLLSSITLTTEDSWEADIPSSQLSEENKRVCGTPPTHTCMCSDTHTTPPSKTVNATVGWSYFSSQQKHECCAWDICWRWKSGDNPQPCLPGLARWYVGVSHSASLLRAVVIGKCLKSAVKQQLSLQLAVLFWSLPARLGCLVNRFTAQRILQTSNWLWRKHH